MAKSLVEEKFDRWIEEANLPEYESIADTILEFCRYGNSTSEIACAHLYVALCGYQVPLERTFDGLDYIRKSWFIRAMMEVVTDEWRGNEEGIQIIWRRHPWLRQKAKAAEVAWNRD